MRIQEYLVLDIRGIRISNTFSHHGELYCMDRKSTASRLKQASVLPFTVFVFLCFPPQELLKSPINGESYFAIFFFIGVLGLSKAFLEKHSNDHIALDYLANIARGICAGLISGFALLSLIILYNWQKNSDIGHLEPLFILFGLAGTAAEGARRMSLEQFQSRLGGD